MTDLTSQPISAPAGVPRRAFLRVAGASAASVGLVLAGCDSTDPAPVVAPDPNRLNLGAGETGLLNYLYLLEQLEAAFYQKVVDAPPTDLLPADKAFFADLRDHEVVHRQSIRFALAANAYDANLTTPLVFNFSTLTLTTRAGVLAAAQQFEDLGVAAYTGALRLVSTPAMLSFLAKIASVEARHAAFVRDLRTLGSFAGDDVVVNAAPLQSVSLSKTPAQVIEEAKAFFLPIVVSASLLPTT